MDNISCFYVREYGFFIDLEGVIAAYCITPNEGDVLINNKSIRAVIPGAKVTKFATEKREGLTLMVIHFKSDKGSDVKYIVGIMHSEESIVQRWIDEVNELYAKKPA